MNIFKLVGSLVIKDEASGTLDKFEKKADKVEGKLGKFGSKMGKLGKGMGEVGKTLSTRVTAPLVALGGTALASADSIDKAYRDIRVGTGATGDDLEGLKKSFDNVFKDIPDSAETAANALANLNTFTGWTGEELESLTKNVLDASRTMGEDGVQNSELFGKALNGWNIEAADAGGHLDHMYRLSADYGIGLGELSGLVTTHGSVLKNAGFEMDEVAHLFSELQSNGISVSRVMPGLNKATRDWASEGKNAKEELNKVIESVKSAGSETEALSIATEVFGSQGAQRMVDAIRNGAMPALDDLGSKFEDSSGAVNSATEDTRTMGEEFQILKNNTMLALEPIGKVILDLAKEYLPPLIKAVQKVAEWFRDLSPAARKIIVVIGGIAAAIGPVLVVMGSIFGAISKIVSVVKIAMPIIKGLGAVFAGISWPVVAVIAAIAALIAIGVALWKNWDKVKEVAGNVFGWLKDFLTKIFEGIVETIRTALDWIVENFGGYFGVLIENVKGYMTMIWENIKVVWEFIKNTFTNVLDFIKALVTLDFQGMKDAIFNQMSNISETVGAIWENIKTFFSEALGRIFEWVVEKFEQIKAKIEEKLEGSSQIVQDIWNYIKNTFKNALDFLKALVTLDFDGMKNAISNQMKNVRELISNIWNGIKEFFSNILQKIIFGVKDKFTEMVTNVRDKSQEVIDKIKEKFGKAYDLVVDPIIKAKDKVKEIVDNIKGFFDNMKLKIPKIDLPKIPKPKLNPGKGKLGLPSISWNAKGGIFDKPTIFDTDKGLQGVGEAGAEAIMPLDKLRGWIGEWMNISNNNDDVSGAIDRASDVMKKALGNTKTQAAPVEYNVTFNIDGNWVVDNDERQRDVVEELNDRVQKLFRSRGEK